jgi:hypothetical protein
LLVNHFIQQLCFLGKSTTCESAATPKLRQIRYYSLNLSMPLRFMRLDLDVHAFASIGSGDCSGAIDSQVAMAGRDPANGLTRSRVETAKATLRQKSCPRLVHLLGVAAACSIGILRTGLC